MAESRHYVLATPSAKSLGTFRQADRIWVGDRGMTSKKYIELLTSGNCRYVCGASKVSLHQFEQPLPADDWRQICKGLEVKLCRSPDGDEQTDILRRSNDRRENKGFSVATVEPQLAIAFSPSRLVRQ